MIFKFFNKDEKSNNNNLIDVACLMIHAAKIDENYTDIERKIIKNTLKKINSNNEDLDKIMMNAEKKESDSNHIQEFTRNIKMMEKKDKKEVVKNIWSIILSDGNSDMYEENLMRRLAGLLYIDDKTIGEIKLNIQSELNQ
tara:strand:- start:113 stop:535 length:423 start_codon:yes stop_codon:yes gene_type:complete